MLLESRSKIEDRNALGLVLPSGPDSARGVEILAAVLRAEPLRAAAVAPGLEFVPAPGARAHRAAPFRWASMSCMTAFASVFRSSVQRSSSSRFKSPRPPHGPAAPLRQGLLLCRCSNVGCQGLSRRTGDVAGESVVSQEQKSGCRELSKTTSSCRDPATEANASAGSSRTERLSVS